MIRAVLLASAVFLFQEEPAPPAINYMAVATKEYCSKSVETAVDEVPNLQLCERIKLRFAFTTSDGHDLFWVGCFDHMPTIIEMMFGLDMGTKIEVLPPRQSCFIQAKFKGGPSDEAAPFMVKSVEPIRSSQPRHQRHHGAD